MTQVTIKRSGDDPLLVGLSIMGDTKLGYTCVYRGTREKAIDALQKVLAVMEHMPEQPIEG